MRETTHAKLVDDIFEMEKTVSNSSHYETLKFLRVLVAKQFPDRNKIIDPSKVFNT